MHVLLVLLCWGSCEGLWSPAGLSQDSSPKHDPPSLPPGIGFLLGVFGVLCVLLVVYECAGRGKVYRSMVALGQRSPRYWQPPPHSTALPTPITTTLPHRRAPLGWAAEFRALDLIRSSDERVQGVSCVSRWADEHAPDVPLPRLLQHQAGCKVVVLGLVLPEGGVQEEEEAVVLIEVPQGVELLAEPFLDRGVRKVAGSRAFVTSTQSLAHYFNTNNSDNCPGRVIWVWNTGRCGSTLLHRLLLCGGVCSLSEPYWVEQLCRHKDSIGHEATTRLLGIALRTDSMLIHRGHMPQHTHTQGAGRGYVVALNPKGNGHALLSLAPHCLPTHVTHTHVFLYRSCVEVVESLGSVLQSDASVWTRLQLALHPATLVRPLPLVSHTLRSWLSSGVVKTGWRHRLATLLTLLWLDALCTWREALASPSLTPTLILRMDELVSPALREVMARKVLELASPPSPHGPSPPPNDPLLHKLVAVFERHSQAGDRMMRSSAVTGQRFLSPHATHHIHALLAQVPDPAVATARLPHSFMMPPQHHDQHKQDHSTPRGDTQDHHTQ